MGLELMTDRYPPITSQTHYPLRHTASFCLDLVFSSHSKYPCYWLAKPGVIWIRCLRWIIFKQFWSLLWLLYACIHCGGLYDFSGSDTVFSHWDSEKPWRIQRWTKKEERCFVTIITSSTEIVITFVWNMYKTSAKMASTLWLHF